MAHFSDLLLAAQSTARQGPGGRRDSLALNVIVPAARRIPARRAARVDPVDALRFD